MRWPTYLFFAVALFGAAMTPYEVFSFSSGAVEEKWTRKDLMIERANVLRIPAGRRPVAPADGDQLRRPEALP